MRHRIAGIEQREGCWRDPPFVFPVIKLAPITGKSVYTRSYSTQISIGVNSAVLFLHIRP